MICLVVDQVNTYISLSSLGTGGGRSPFFVNIKIYTYYAKKHERTRVFIPSSPYLFPFLVDDGNKSQDKTIDKKNATVRLYRNTEARISYHLRKLGAKIGVKGKLTLYVARQSWATAVRDNHISISVISEALGHHSVTTTQIYLRSIKSSEVDDANARILAVL